MKQLFMCLSIVLMLLALDSDALPPLEFMLHQFIYISIFLAGIMYLGRSFRRACIDK